MPSDKGFDLRIKNIIRIPDPFFSRYLVEVNRKNQYLYDFTFDFMDRHRQETKNIKDYKQLLKYLDRFDLVNEMADYAAARGLKRDEKGIRDSFDVLDSLIKAFISRPCLWVTGLRLP